MKPHIGLSQLIESSRSLQEFCIKKYKHLSKLKVVKLLNTTVNRNLSKPIPVLHKLSVSVKSLDLSQYDSLVKYSASQIKKITKKFHKIARISMLGTSDSTKTLLLAINTLKRAKSLEHLHLKGFFDFSSSLQFLHLVSQSKLKTISLTPKYSPRDDLTWLLSFLRSLPSNIEDLSLDWKNQMKDGSKLDLSLNHLHNLQKLQLGMPLPLLTFSRIFKSIQDPLKLKVLRFHIEKSQREESYLSDLQSFLENCSNLESLSLTLKTDMDVFLSNSNMNKLKQLSIESTGGLLRCLDFIQQQKESLESLSLTSKVGVYCPRNELFEGLKPLKRLKKLKLDIKLEMCNITALDLAQLVEALECLEEMDVMDMYIFFSESGFSSLCEALEKRSGSLRSLRISFSSLTQKDSNLLIQTLTSMSGLEHIALKDFEIEDPCFYGQLRDLVCCKNKGLNEVVLKGFKRGKTREYCESLINMLRSMIKKPTMKKLCYGEDAKIKGAFDFKGLEVLSLTDDVLKEIHHFDYLHLPPYLCQPVFPYWDLGLRNWNPNLD